MGISKPQKHFIISDENFPDCGIAKILLLVILHYNLFWILTSLFKQKMLTCKL